MRLFFRHTGIGLLSAAAMFSATVSAQKSPLTLEDLSRIQQVVDVAVSPDGDQVAYLRTKPRKLYDAKDGKSYVELYLTDDEGNSRPFITGDVNLSKIRWSGASDKIYFLSKS